MKQVVAWSTASFAVITVFLLVLSPLRLEGFGLEEVVSLLCFGLMVTGCAGGSIAGIIACCQIAKRLGYDPYAGLLMLIPVVNLCVLFYGAFREAPNERRIRVLKRSTRSDSMISRIVCLPLLVLIVGCGQSATPPPPSQTITPPPKRQCRIERSFDAEAALAQLGHKAWVFRHSGGPLNPDLSVLYKPAGKDAKEETVFHATGDPTLQIINSWAPSRREARRGKGGLIIVTFPDFGLSTDGQIRLSFSLDGASCFANATPTEVFGASEVHQGLTFTAGAGGAVEEPVSLSPGESHILADQTLQPSSSHDTPLDERQSIRYILSVTALQEGEMPAAPEDDK